VTLIATICFAEDRDKKQELPQYIAPFSIVMIPVNADDAVK
jgi:hypothetical protein